jgi:hypothetical protein
VFLTDGPQLIAGSLQGTDQDCPESGQPRHQKLRGHPVGFTGFGSGQRGQGRGCRQRTGLSESRPFTFTTCAELD